MPESHSLAAYHVLLKNVNTHSNVSLETFQNEVGDLFALLQQYFIDRQDETLADDVRQSSFSIKNYEIDTEQRTIRGIIESGFWGEEATLRHIHTQDEIPRLREHAEVREFCFLLKVPETDSDGCILILHRINSRGVKTILQVDLWDFFEEFAPNHKIFLNPIVHGAVLDAFNRAEIKKLRFVKKQVENTTEEAFLNSVITDNEAYMEFSVNARRNRNLDNLKAIIMPYIQSFVGEARTLPLSRVFENIPVEYDRVKLDLLINGKQRVMDLANPFSFSAYYDITAQMLNSTGLSKYESISNIAGNYLIEITNSITRFGVISSSQKSSEYAIIEDSEAIIEQYSSGEYDNTQ